MSGINSLPGGGKNFSANRFKRKFKYLSEHSKVVSPLSENEESIINAVNKYQKVIRRGSFGKIQQRRAIRQIKNSDNLGIVNLRKVKKIISKLGEGQVDESLTSQARINAKDKSEDALKPKVRINRANRENLPGPRLAGVNNNRGSGFSSAYSSEDYNSTSANRPLVSINQKEEFNRGTGVSNSSKLNSRGISSAPASSSRPSIPLSR